MRIELKQIGEDPFAWNEECTFEVEALDRPEVVALSAVKCDGQVQVADPGYLLRARLRYEQSLLCDRCLGTVKEPVATSLELLLLPPTALEEADEVELEEQDLSLLALEGEELDTEPLILEQVQLNLPMKPLCSPECQGLCPQCGANRNLGQCECREEETDPRWEQLAALRDRLP